MDSLIVNFLVIILVTIDFMTIILFLLGTPGFHFKKKPHAQSNLCMYYIYMHIYHGATNSQLSCHHSSHHRPFVNYFLPPGSTRFSFSNSHARFASQARNLGLWSHAKDSIPGLGFSKFMFALNKMSRGPAGGRGATDLSLNSGLCACILCTQVPILARFLSLPHSQPYISILLIHILWARS